MSERFGTWQLEALLAVGGLGEIWRSRRGVDVAAIKRLHTHLVRNEEALRQFAVEQHLATTLPRHPNVVHAHEASDVGGRPYLALDLLAGQDLRRIVSAKTAISRTRVIEILCDACDAAQHLHAHGWVHGDVNPSNLLVADDRVVLVDLGIARASGEAGAVRGTHAYMAPEQVKAEAWTAATDVFALGVVLWELSAGARLFHRGPPWLSMAAVVEDPVPALADSALDAIAQAALVKDPAGRIASAAELGERLRELITS